MARFHVRATPPTSPLLFEYGYDFPDFIESYEHPQSMPWLAMSPASSGHGSTHITPQMRSRWSPRLWLRSSGATGRHCSDTSSRDADRALAISGGHYFRSEPGRWARVTASEPEDALVTRPGLEVAVRRLPPDGAVYLTHLLAGEPLGAAVSAAIADSPAFDLPANIGGMLEAGAIAAAQLGDSAS
jgi:hypothetical protein